MKTFLVVLASLVCYVTPQVITNVYVGSAQVSSVITSAVFSVQYGSAITASSVHTKIPFNVVRRNDQNVYNKATAEFTAPIKGVYSFYFSARSGSGYMAVYLHSSATGYLASAVAGTTNTQASNMVNIELDAGTKISVKLNPAHTAGTCSPACSTFSGHLMYATS